ncbi:MAG: GTP-binding protein [Cyanobacteria bacterium P01_A01_bin.68]
MTSRLPVPEPSEHNSENNLEDLVEHPLSNKSINDEDSTCWQEDLDNAIFSFEDIQAELNYKQALTSLQNLVTNLDLTVDEKQGLEIEISELETMLGKLEGMVVQIAAFGMVGRGKSSLLNALVGQNVFETGPLHGVTRSEQRVNWQITEEVFGESGITKKAAFTTNGQSQVELIDTPGLDEVDGETRAVLAHSIARQADLILFVVSGDITKVEHEALCLLREAGKPMLLVFNKVDQYPEADRVAIYQTIKEQRVRELLSPDEIVMCAASPLVRTMIRRTDGSRGIQSHQGKPAIAPLKIKILEILHREGKALVALNTMLYADNINDNLLERKLQIREESANQLIWKAVITKSVAIALNPLTVIDIVSGAAIDVTMIIGLSKLYGIPMTEKGAVKLLQKIALSMGGISASELLANLGLSSLKTLLGISAPATGGVSLGAYVSVAMTQATVAGVSSYGIGQVTKTYLASGATWGPEGPKAVINKILSTLDDASIISRIREELKMKLLRSQKKDRSKFS